MLLGYEFELLSMIAKTYQRSSSGVIRFSEENYKRKFTDDQDLLYLTKIENLGIVQRDRQIIKVNTHKWAELLAIELQKSMEHLGFNYMCSYEEKGEEIQIYEDETKQIKLKVNFNEDEYDKQINTINFCYVDTFQYYLFWLNIINDLNTLEMLCAFIRNELTRFSFDNRIKFNFFEGLSEEIISDIYNVRLKEYFKNSGFTISEVSEPLRENLLKIIRKNDYDSYQVKLQNHELIVVKIEKVIEFLAFIEGELRYTDQVVIVLSQLKDKLLAKVSDYRTIMMFNNNKIIDNTRKSIQILSLLLVPINMLMFYGTTLGMGWIKEIVSNKFVYFTATGILLFVTIGVITLIIIPSIRLSIFKWRIK